jgi:hypothetical protein
MAPGVVGRAAVLDFGLFVTLVLWMKAEALFVTIGCPS